jgi:hypothetical protein
MLAPELRGFAEFTYTNKGLPEILIRESLLNGIIITPGGLESPTN